MVTEKGARVAFSKLLSEETLNARAQSMRVPDWVLVLLKQAEIQNLRQRLARFHQFDKTWKNRGKV